MGGVDSAVLGFFGVGSLVGLGFLRERALARRAAPRDSEEIGPPTVGDPLPGALSRLVEGRLLTTAGDNHFVVVLGSGCGACEAYTRRLAEVVTSRALDARDVTVLATGGTSHSLVDRLRSAGVMAVHDSHPALSSRRLALRTPATIAVDARSGLVTRVWSGDAEPSFTGHRTSEAASR